MEKHIDIANPTRTKAILNSYGLRAKKKFGQNFLTDVNVLYQIVDTADVNENDIVIEIGPGLGALTEQLAKKAKQVLAFEIDADMVAILNDTLMPYNNIEVIQNDILKVDLKKELKERFGSEDVAVKIVANLPYYITTPILLKLLKENINWQNIVVMMQKEMADRLDATVGTKDYGALTLTVGHFANVRTAIKVSAQSFNPSPRVDSAVVILTPKEIENINDGVFNLIRECFNHRRKSLLNNLQQYYGKDKKDQIINELEKLGIDPQIRAERLEMKDFQTIEAALDKL